MFRTGFPRHLHDRLVVAVLLAGLCLLPAAAVTAAAADWHVAPGGSADGTGAEDAPWSLFDVLAGDRDEVRPGDTVWMAGGTYMVPDNPDAPQKRFAEVSLSGTGKAPITFRGVSGPRVTVDGGLLIEGHDLVFRGFEIRDTKAMGEKSSNDCIYTANKDDFPRAGERCTFINLVLHEARQGIGLWSSAEGAEVYGCIIYDVGRMGEYRGHGHGIYTQSAEDDTLSKRIVDNVIWGGYCHGVQAYGSDQVYVKHYEIVGNIFFSNGVAARPDASTPVVVGSGNPTVNLTVSDNVSYLPPRCNRDNFKLYYYKDKVNRDLVFERNVLANGRYALQLGRWKTIEARDNWIFARALMTLVPVEGAEYEWNHNTYVQSTWPWGFEYDGWGLYNPETRMRFSKWQEESGLDADSEMIATARRYPEGVIVRVRPNQYEKGRAHVAVLNWDRAESVEVDLSGVLEPGRPYRVFNVQDLWGEPVAAGTYEGGTVTLPALLSWTAPEFDAYLVLPGAEGTGR
jgi:hypothetical protein